MIILYLHMNLSKLNYVDIYFKVTAVFKMAFLNSGGRQGGGSPGDRGTEGLRETGG